MDYRNVTAAVVKPCGTRTSFTPGPHRGQSPARAQVLTPEALPDASPAYHYDVQKGAAPPSNFAGRRTNQIHDAMRELKAKLFSPAGSVALRQVCCELADLADEPSYCPSGAAEYAVFKRLPLALRVKSLGARRYELLLPRTPVCAAAAVGSVAAGDAEEQGPGGSCDRFVSMLPASCREISRRACPLGLVPKLLPYGAVSTGARYIGSCFWMWLCIVDDLTENLVGKDWAEAESDIMHAFGDNPDSAAYHNPISDVTLVSLALRMSIDRTSLCEAAAEGAPEPAEEPWRYELRCAVREVLAGFKAERPLLARKKISLSEWMRVRMVTISARPFMIIARASLGLDPALSPFGNPLAEGHITVKGKRTNLARVECLQQLIMGLQNDIIGWEKDFKTKNPLNTIQILRETGTRHSKAMRQVVDMHNDLVDRLCRAGELAWSETFELPPPTPSRTCFSAGGLRRKASASSFRADYHRDSLLSTRRQEVPSASANNDNARKYLELMIGFSAGMADWMAASKRYAV